MIKDSLPVESAFRSQHWSSVFTGLAISISLLTFTGWQLDIKWLIRPIPGLAAMNPMTALSFLLLGISFLCDIGTSTSRWAKKIAITFTVLSCLICLMRVFPFLYPGTDTIDHLLFPNRLQADLPGNLSNRMAVNTAICILCLSFSSWWINTASQQLWFLSQTLCLLTIFVSLFSIIGYLYRIPEYDAAFSNYPMSVHTAVCIFLLAAALLAANRKKGFMQDLTLSLSGSTMARRLIPIAILGPICLGYLRLYGYWYHLFSVEFGVAILVTSIILVFLTFIWYNTILLNRRDLANRAVQDQLLLSEEQYRLLTSSVKDYAIFMIDPEGYIASWNDGAEAIKGYRADEVIGRHISIFYEDALVEADEPGYNLRMARKMGRFNNEGWRLRKDGSRFWADIVFTPIYDEVGALRGYTKITRDITERKLFREKVAYQARLMEDSSDAVLSTDSAYRIVTWNHASEQLFGYTAEEAVGKYFNDVVSSGLDETARNEIRRELLKVGYWRGEIVYFHKGGGDIYIMISVSGTRDEEDRMNGYVLVCKDITKRVKAEEQLRYFNELLEQQVKEKTAELREVFERVSDGFMAFDKIGQITYVNQKASEMNRRPTSELIGRNFWVEFPSAAGNEFGMHFHQAIGLQENRHFEMFSPSLQMWIECYMYPSSNGLSLFFRNITGQIKTKELLIQSNAELRELASHLQDIREEERHTIAREIHDELGQQLTGLKMDLSWISKKAGSLSRDEIQHKVAATLSLLDDTIHTVRRIATDLRPSVLDDLGLIAAIEWLSGEFEKRSGIRTVFRTSVSRTEFSPAVSIGLFRICQESLTNVARHAGAHNVCISLEEAGLQLTMAIIDDGKGLDKWKSQGSKTLGLVGMKERAMMMGGELKISNGITGGVRLEVNIPHDNLLL